MVHDTILERGCGRWRRAGRWRGAVGRPDRRRSREEHGCDNHEGQPWCRADAL